MFLQKTTQMHDRLKNRRRAGIAKLEKNRNAGSKKGREQKGQEQKGQEQRQAKENPRNTKTEREPERNRNTRTHEE